MNKIMETNSHENNRYSYLTYYYKVRSTRVEKRYRDLLHYVEQEGFTTILKAATRTAGRRPGWHLEVEGLNLVIQAGFSQYVEHFKQLQTSEFEASLEKSERLMKEEKYFNGDKRSLVGAALRVAKACKFPQTKFTPSDLETAANEQLNHRSSSGYPLFVRKGKVLEELISQARDMISNPTSESWFWPCYRGFRIQIREEFSKLYRKVRIMYPYPGAIVLIEDTFVMPFVQHFINTDTFYIIGRSGLEIGKLIKSNFENSKRISVFDVSAFDQNMLRDPIILAFGILRQQLRLSYEESVAFDNMVEYFCVNIFVSKDMDLNPYSFVRQHGIPSGSGFTNMIGTIAHAIILEYLEPGILETRKALICGDDNLFDSHALNLKALAKNYELHFNLPIALNKCGNFTSSRRLSFLGFEFINYERHISYKLALNQFLWHTDWLTDLSPFERIVSRAASIFLNGKNGKYLFTKLFPDIVKSVEMGIDVRFTYLNGYKPPLSKEQLSKDFVIAGSSLNTSLSEHLEQGYNIR